MPAVKRVLIKLSGGAMSSKQSGGFDPEQIDHITEEILKVVDLGVEVAIVVGGGNILRGSIGQTWGLERVEADSIGMLGTIVNALMLRGVFQSKSEQEFRVLTAVRLDAVCEPYIRLRALNHLNKGRVVILAGGIGQPFVTTDYPAVQRSIELHCDLLLVAKEGVNGVYDSDPKTNKNAKLFKSLAYSDFIEKDIQVMDQTAILLAKEHDLPICIFNFNEKGAMARICEGEKIGTFISPQTKLEEVVG